MQQANFKKIVMPRPAYDFVTYLMEYCFTFNFASRKFPRRAFNRPDDLDFRSFDL